MGPRRSTDNETRRHLGTPNTQNNLPTHIARYLPAESHNYLTQKRHIHHNPYSSYCLWTTLELYTWNIYRQQCNIMATQQKTSNAHKIKSQGKQENITTKHHPYVKKSTKCWERKTSQRLSPQQTTIWKVFPQKPPATMKIRIMERMYIAYLAHVVKFT